MFYVGTNNPAPLMTKTFTAPMTFRDAIAVAVESHLATGATAAVYPADHRGRAVGYAAKPLFEIQ
jgi:hypothetical protein